MTKIISLLMVTPLFILSCSGEDKTHEKVIEKEIDSVVTKVIDTDYERVEFESLDGLMITANLFEVDQDAPTIVLCHQARFNKFEYDGIAQRLNEMGYNCLAIDQRSGGPIASEQNETNLSATKKGLPVDFLDAAQDITAAVNYASEKYGQPIILWGSSYSSTLVLYEAIKNENIEAVISFSPGDYFAEELGSLVEKLEGFDKPMFITSAKNEIPWAEELLVKMTMNENQIQFKPEGDGWHGSRALWPNQDGGEEYWDAITKWLESIK